MIWHFSQRNIAAGSLILWMIVINFFNFINPLIWPRDNMEDWWDGEGLCDIQARIQVGAVVALPACAVIIARRLANVMDTNNITMIPSKRSILIERLLEIGCCWVYPGILMITYYIVQPFRYFVFGISGCVAAYASSWPSLVVVWIWGCITILIAAFYAGKSILSTAPFPFADSVLALLGFRLYQYRREFHRLIAARNTTKSRFMRLFLMAIVIVTLLLPYSFFLLYQLCSTMVDQYSWSTVHGPKWNSVVKVPSYGTVRLDRWGEVAVGYFLFILFGTGTDANNTYKRMLCSIGLGKIFPSLYDLSESSGSATPSGVTFARRFTSSWSTKARSLFCKSGTFTGQSQVDSFTSSEVHRIPTNDHEPILPPRPSTRKTGLIPLIKAFFGRGTVNQTILPMHRKTSSVASSSLNKSVSPDGSTPSGVYAHAWAVDNTGDGKVNEGHGVHVVREVHQAHQEKGKDKQTMPDPWA